MALPPLKDVVELNDLAQSIYLKLTPEDYVGMLAPSLGTLIAKDLKIRDAVISTEFADPMTFLSVTYFRAALKEALRYINDRLNIPDVSVIPLTHAMGLGKTHFLVLLYHLYVNIPNYWQELCNNLNFQEIYNILVSETNYRFDVAQKTLVIPIDLKFLPPDLDPYRALAENTKRVFQKKKEHLKGVVTEKHLNSIEQLLTELPSYDPVDAAKKLGKLIVEMGVTIPVLILIDELYASIIDAVWGASPSYIESLKKTLLFIQNVVETLFGYRPVVLVYASAIQDVEKWNEVKTRKTGKTEADALIEVAKHFEDRVHRFQFIYSVRDIDEDDALSIVRKRIMRYKAPVDAILNEEQLMTLRKRIADIVGGDLATVFINDLRGSYPFSPIYKEFVRKIIIPSYSREFTNVQHLRDLIKISTVAVAKALKHGDSYLVSTAHIEHEDVKHLLSPDIAYEWRKIVDTWSRYVTERIKEVEKAKMVRGALSSVYIKSVTDNVVDLIKMLSQRPETISREDIEKRALSATRVILSLVGFVKDEDLKFYSDVLRELKNVPFIHVIERPNADYYLASLISNPWQLINNVHESILSNLKNEKGEIDVRKSIDYLAITFEKYQLVSRFKEKAHINIEITSIDDILSGEELRKMLNKDVFTVVVLSPIDVAKKVFIEKTGMREDVSYREVEKMIIEALGRSKNELRHLNMFAIVVPETSKSTLIDLVTKLAEIEACEKVNELISSNVERLAEQELASRKELTKIAHWAGLTEERFKQIIMEAIKMVREKIKTFTVQLTSSAVQDFVSSFISVFKKVITYNPETEAFEVKDLNIWASNEGIKRLDQVFASLPVWISNTIVSTLKVRDAHGIAEQIKSWIKQSVSKSDIIRDAILKTGKHSMSIDGIVDALVRGWKEIPVKPLSIAAIETGINELNEIRIPVDDPMIGVVVLHIKDRELIIEKIGILPPPSPPAPPTRRVTSFKVFSRDKVAILLSYMARSGKLTELIHRIDLELQLGQKEDNKAVVKISGTSDKVVVLAPEIMSIINKHMNELTLCKAEVALKAGVEEKRVKEELNKVGLTPDEIVYAQN
ncbi:MAG: hypothetical protein LZ173_07020 [Thaumarchaeota archaeon]|jgi:nitrate reductase NapAB chaperone NapD|nr:hypothetical protein [Candidatus Geocrenenecus arthurdayi]